MLRHLQSSLISWKPVSDQLLTAGLLHNMAKSLSWLVMLPQILETRTSKIHITVSYRVSSKCLPTWHFHWPDWCQCNYCTPSHDKLEQPCVTGNIYIDHVTNDNGEHLLLLCHSTRLCVTDTWYLRKSVHHWILHCSDGITKKEIIPILISKCCWTCINNCRVYRGAKLGCTDHQLLIANIWMTLKIDHCARPETKLVMSHSEDPHIWATYSSNIVNRFYAILEENASDKQHFKGVVTGAAKEALGNWHKLTKQPWISDMIIQIISGHCKLQLWGNLRSTDDSNHTYNESVKRKLPNILGWRDKETWRCSSAQQQRKLREMFQMLWQAKASPRSKNYLVKDSNCIVLRTKTKCLDHWVEHFQQLLNYPSTKGNTDLPKTLAIDDNTDICIEP